VKNRTGQEHGPHTVVSTYHKSSSLIADTGLFDIGLRVTESCVCRHSAYTRLGIGIPHPPCTDARGAIFRAPEISEKARRVI
jgi:hypothetical protein